MCGIVGALTFDAFEKKSEEKIRTEANIFISTQILQATVERGKDATGISMLWSDGNYTGLKMGIPSPDFIARFGDTEKDFEGILKLWREYPKMMKIFMGHCRKSSVGNSFDNKNNHPIQVGHTMVVHNGTLTNHENIFDKLDCNRIGDVDSEAIGHLLNHYTKNGKEPYTIEMIKEVTRRLAGTYHVMAMSGNNPFQLAQFRDGRPAEMVLVKPLKMVYIASEKKYLENVLFEFNKFGKLFASGVKFPHLKKADVEFKTLEDDSCAVWDLTLPITDATKIEDLYAWEKTPLRVDKIWGSASTTTAYNNRSTNYTTAKKTVANTTEVTVTGKQTGSSTDIPDDGLVWSKSMNKFKTQAGIDKSKDLGAVMIDVEKGELLDTDGELEDSIKEVDKEEVENLITGAADIEELALDNVSDAVDDADGKKSTTQSDLDSDNESNVSGSTVEIDMTTDPDAIKAAEEFVEKGLVKYEDDDEVAVDLEISDASVLRPLPLFSLANRLRKFVFSQGFIAGYITRKKEIKKVPATTQVLDDKKLENAEKKIRAMKFVVKVMAAALEQRTKGNSEEGKKSLMEAAIVLVDGKLQATRLDLSSSFSVGDIQNIPHLKDIQKLLEEKKLENK